MKIFRSKRDIFTACLAAVLPLHGIFGASTTTTSPKGNEVTVAADNTVAIPGHDDILIVSPIDQLPITIEPEVSFVPAPNWEHAETRPEPMRATFSSTVNEVVIEVDFETVAKKQNGDPDDSETVTVRLLKMEVSSEKATNPNGTHTPKQTLEFAIPSPGNLAAGQEQDALYNALVIYYKDVVSGTSIEVDPFDVKFKTPGLSTTAWFETGNNNSSSTRGDLQNPISEEATLSIAAQGGDISGPVDGGLYKYSASLSDDLSFPVQVWLPVAGPSIDAAFNSELSSISAWAGSYRDHLMDVRVPNIRTENLILFNPLVPNSTVAAYIAAEDMKVLGKILDWYGAPSGQFTPSGGPKNNTPLGIPEHRTTIRGVVVDWPKRNNILYAFIGRQMDIPEWAINEGPNLFGGENNTPDDDYALASYQIGFSLFNGDNLESVMGAIGREMHVPGGWTEKEWPSFETSSDTNALNLNAVAGALMDSLLEYEGLIP